MDTPLYPHQRDAVTRALNNGGNLALLHEPGLGKTRTCLEIFTRLREKSPRLKLLVIAPLSILEPVWGVDIEKWTSWRWTLVKTLNASADIWLVNYETAIRPKTLHILEQLWTSPVMLVCDESTRLRDPRSLTTKTILALAARCQYRIVCSGTPAPNGLWELHGQMKVVNPAIVHRSFYAWRREYFYLGRNGQALQNTPTTKFELQQAFRYGYSWRITPERRDQLLARFAPICSWVRKHEALELPERITTIRHVTLSDLEFKAYEQMRKQLIVEFEQEAVTAEIALTKLLRLRQLASGFVYGETERHRIGSSRLNVLRETLEELGNQPVIIWCQFQEEIEQIAVVLGDKAVTLYAKTKDHADSLARFGREAQYLIAHPRSAGHGLNLTQAATCVWYSLDWSFEAHIQANDRIHRIGQRRSCLYVYLMAKGLIDDQIWKVLHEKQDLQTAIDAALRSQNPSSHRETD